MIKLIRLTSGIFLGMLIIGMGRASAQTVVQGYSSSSTLEDGQIVQTVPGSPNKIEAVEQKNEAKMFGAVVNPANSPITLSGGSSSEQYYVSASGTYPVLVDNENGPIATGDYISVSSLPGIGDVASSSDTTVIGKATTSFSGSKDSISSITTKNSAGSSVTLSIGVVSVNIDINRNPNLVSQNVSDFPSFLRQTGASVVNKPVSTVKAYLSLVVLIASLIIAGSMLYGGVKSSITAIGRNPLSRPAIIKGLIQVTISSFFVFILGIFAVYLLLRF
ncbi:MAG TPA: hypothetical protein VMR18_03240 [Candidatus Saccharimonadales bacterium]|jgi:hypothetical protein|nr:hypothetical protein [Candidatus Saccharimonadales bacterium]